MPSTCDEYSFTNSSDTIILGVDLVLLRCAEGVSLSVMKTDTPLLSNLNPNTPSEFRSPVNCLSSLFALNIALVEKIAGVSSLERTSYSGRLELQEEDHFGLV
jgi:hypothetical protein